MRHSETLGALAPAFVAAQAELRNPTADQTATVPTKAGGRYSYRYAALADILGDLRHVLTRHGLALLQEDVTTEIGVGVYTRIQHESGEWIELGPLLLPRGEDAQASGSSLTYARRYALTAALGLAPDEDDDGKSAGTSGVPAAPTKRVVRDDSPSPASEPAPAAPGASSGGLGTAAGDEAPGTTSPESASFPDERASGGTTSGEAATGDGRLGEGSDLAASPDPIAGPQQWAAAARMLKTTRPLAQLQVVEWLKLAQQPRKVPEITVGMLDWALASIVIAKKTEVPK